MSVKVGTTTHLTSGDLDAVFDKIAEKRTAPDLDVIFNAAGRAAMRDALDCIFDADHLTLSSIWVNEHESELAMRNYTVVLFESGSPSDYYVYEHDFTNSAKHYAGFTSLTSGGCFNLEVAVFGTNDYYSDLGANPSKTRCGPDDCDESCTGGGDSLCSCPGTGGCDSVTGPDTLTGSNGSIMKGTYN